MQVRFSHSSDDNLPAIRVHRQTICNVVLISSIEAPMPREYSSEVTYLDLVKEYVKSCAVGGYRCALRVARDVDVLSLIRRVYGFGDMCDRGASYCSVLCF